jgi:non-reducing end alpha-L-arabinofuranosidase
MRNKVLTMIPALSICFLFIGTLTIASAKCPCDIYAAGGTPCVAAHSTARALYSSYNGYLYQVRRADGKTKEIGLLTPGGLANAAAQDSFLNGTTGTISKIYDQSSNKNDLVKAPAGGFLHNGGLEANATAAKILMNGHQVYGVYTTSSWDNEVGAVGYRNNATTGIAIKGQPEGIYMVCSGKHYNQWCCFDYGNAQTDNTADEAAIMETVYFGTSTQWGYGSSKGPWVMADLEWGLFAGGALVNSSNTPVIADYVTGMVKGDSTNLYSIRGGNAQSGILKTMYSGTRPSGYYPMKKEGAIVLGVGGDNSHTGEGTFFEGAITSGYPSDTTEDSVQANIIAAGYGSTTTSTTWIGAGNAVKESMFNVRYNQLNGNAVINYTLQDVGRVNINIVDQCGRKVAAIVNGIITSGRHEAVWDAKRVPAGVYLCRAIIDGVAGWTGKIVVEK